MWLWWFPQFDESQVRGHQASSHHPPKTLKISVLATCRQGWTLWIGDGVPEDPAILLDLQKLFGFQSRASFGNLRKPPAASKVYQKKCDKEKRQRNDTNNYMLKWGGPPLGVQNLYTFPTRKMCWNKRNNLICRPDSAGKSKMRRFLFSVVLKFSVLVVQVFEISFYCAIYKIHRGFEVFEVFRFNRTGNAFVMFFPRGTRIL